MTISPLKVTLIENGVEKDEWADSHERLCDFVARLRPQVVAERYGRILVRDTDGVWLEDYRTFDALHLRSTRLFLSVEVDWHSRAIEAEQRAEAAEQALAKAKQVTLNDFYAITRLLEAYTDPFVTDLQVKLGALRQILHGVEHHIGQTVVDELERIETTTYYVAPNGDDRNSGLAEHVGFGVVVIKAWRTVNKALEVSVNGDTINIRAGKYSTRSRRLQVEKTGNYWCKKCQQFVGPNHKH